MKSRIAVSVLTAAVLVVTGVVAGESLKSGPAVGSNLPGPFHPLNITGAHATEKHCLV